MSTTLRFRSGFFTQLEDEMRRLLAADNVVDRIKDRDHTLWKPLPVEIADRLGWLDSPVKMVDGIADIDRMVEDVRADGYNFALLLGMGGSSLAPEVFRKVFGVAKGFLNLEILDSTDPGAVLAYAACLDFKKTLFVVSTKSGGTVETLSLMKYFYNLTAEKLGNKEAGRHFCAITDPKSALEETATKFHFRRIFLNDPKIGGRYSALSFFGLVPAALVGIDIKRLLERAKNERDDLLSQKEAPSVLLGGILGEMAARGRDKLTFIFSGRLIPLGGWIEQLLAESTGKEGKGILPVVGEPCKTPEFYGTDRVFCSIRLEGDAEGEVHLRALAASGSPVVDLTISDVYDLGAHFFFWEIATAAAGWRLKINPFDQPNVEASKVLARKMIEKYLKEQSLPEDAPLLDTDGFSVYGRVAPCDPEGVLWTFLSQAVAPSYVAFMAYMMPSPWFDDAVRRLREAVLERFSVATTFGYGPRFLHSTGQLHKGDAGHGLFVQFIADDVTDAPIPDEIGDARSSLTFGLLKKAQALGDFQALAEQGRKVIRIHFHGNFVKHLERLTDFIRSTPG